MAFFQITGRNLTFSGNPSICAYSIEIDHSVWTMTERPYVLFSDGERIPFPQPDREEIVKTGTTEGIGAVYTAFGNHKITVRTKAEIEKMTDDVYFTLQVEGDAKCEIERVSFPAPFDFGAKYGDTPTETDANLPASYTVLSRMQGTLIPAGTQIKIWDGEIFERDGYMPIYGQVRANTGYLAIYDTPYDVCYEMRYEDGEKVAPMWRTSLGRIAYPRRMLYRFMKNCDYNDFAKSYRAYVHQRGRLITLREKAVKNPRVNQLFGCPVIHTDIAWHASPDSIYYKPGHPEENDRHTEFKVRTEQLKALHEKGLKKAYIHLDGWGNHGYDNLHPSPLPPHEGAGGADGMRELAKTASSLGYIFGIHDQYRDYYYDAPDFSFDNSVVEADGGHPYCAIWPGGKHSYLCSSVARDYVRRNYAMFEEMDIPIEAAYLDVFSVVHLDECFSEAHPATREQCAAYRRECLDILTDRGIIPSSEEVLDCILPSQVLCHHAPYVTTTLGKSDDDAVGIPIPLLNLVYHDCVVIPWIGRKNVKGGWGIPGNDSAYAHAWLNGNPQYLDIDADEGEIAEVMETCRHAENLTHETIEKHEFISADRRIQRTTFSNGVIVEVNFDTDEIRVL